jgi:TonB family protein
VYAPIAQRKTAPPPPDEPDSAAVIEDTTGIVPLAFQIGSAPPGSGPPQIIGGEGAIQNVIDQDRLYPMVALEAEIPGEAIVRFTVDVKGTPGNFEIMREEPEGFDFGEMAIQALQKVKFQPGYNNGEYIESPATQLVRFTP